ncbi:MAG: GtrA family protein [Acidimicrobiales bacterium]|nr:GtrA family protein [Acidimicrobiales bacterium]
MVLRRLRPPMTSDGWVIWPRWLQFVLEADDAVPMAWVRGRLDDLEWWRALRYSAVSVVGIVITQTLLVGAHGVLGLAPIVANVAAVSVAALPVFLLNRAWVWQRSGRSSFRREVVPFWGFTLAGLALSTVAVAATASVTESTPLIAAANIGAFGVLWVAKFFVLDEVVFAAAAVTATSDDLTPATS